MNFLSFILHQKTLTKSENNIAGREKINGKGASRSINHYIIQECVVIRSESKTSKLPSSGQILRRGTDSRGITITLIVIITVFFLYIVAINIFFMYWAFSYYCN